MRTLGLVCLAAVLAAPRAAAADRRLRSYDGTLTGVPPAGWSAHRPRTRGWKAPRGLLFFVEPPDTLPSDPVPITAVDVDSPLYSPTPPAARETTRQIALAKFAQVKADPRHKTPLELKTVSLGAGRDGSLLVIGQARFDRNVLYFSEGGRRLALIFSPVYARAALDFAASLRPAP